MVTYCKGDNLFYSSWVFYCPVCALVNNYLFIVHLSTVEVEVFHGMFSVNAIHI